MSIPDSAPLIVFGQVIEKIIGVDGGFTNRGGPTAWCWVNREAVNGSDDHLDRQQQSCNLQSDPFASGWSLLFVQRWVFSVDCSMFNFEHLTSMHRIYRIRLGFQQGCRNFWFPNYPVHPVHFLQRTRHSPCKIAKSKAIILSINIEYFD